MGTIVEEADETVFWLELLVETGIVDKKKLESLLREANELLAIFAASLRTSKDSLHRISNGPMTKSINAPIPR